MIETEQSGFYDQAKPYLEDKDGFREWINTLPDAGIKGDIVNQYLTQKTGLRIGDVSWLPRPKYINKFSDLLNTHIPTEIRQDNTHGSQYGPQPEWQGFSKKEILDVFDQSQQDVRTVIK